MTILNYFTTEAEAITAQAYDYEKKKEVDRLTAVANDTAAGLDEQGNAITTSFDKWTTYYAVTTSWDSPPKLTLTGVWVYAVCPCSDAVHETIPYSADLFPIVEED